MTAPENRAPANYAEQRALIDQADIPPPWDDQQLAGLARRLIELTQQGNEAAAMSLLRQAAGVDD